MKFVIFRISYTPKMLFTHFSGTQLNTSTKQIIFPKNVFNKKKKKRFMMKTLYSKTNGYKLQEIILDWSKVYSNFS